MCIRDSPKEEACKIAVDTVREQMNSSAVRVAVFVLFGQEDYDIYRRYLEKNEIEYQEL